MTPSSSDIVDRALPLLRTIRDSLYAKITGYKPVGVPFMIPADDGSNVLLLAYAFAAVFLSSTLAAPHVTVNTTTVIGTPVVYQGNSQEFFGGIPFGSAERFSPTTLLSFNTSTFDASDYGALCAQPFPTDFAIAEDCLTINILRPARDMSGADTSAALPVMVWIYGGTFLQSQIYNGSALVANSVARGTPIIHVSLNYRLGPFGFPQGDEAMKRNALNLGLKDQILALQWIKLNVAAFGGDPSKITVFGQSAGAISIAIHYLNPSFNELVHAAIMQSGSQASLPLYGPLLRAPAWQSFSSATPECSGVLNNATFDCLRTASLSTLLTSWLVAEGTTLGPAFAPVIDGENGVIPDLPSKLLSKGKFARIPFITGTVLDEGTGGLPTDFDYSNETLALELLIAEAQPYNVNPGTIYESTLERFISLYPPIPALGSPFGTGNETFGFDPQFKRYAAILGDFVFQALRRSWVQTATSFGLRTFGYIFTDHAALDTSQPWLGVHHAVDLNYIYGMQIINGSIPQANTSRIMMDYWTSFATSLTPNDGKGLTSRINWPQYNLSSPKILQIGESLRLVPDNYRKSAMDFLNSVPEIVGH